MYDYEQRNNPHQAQVERMEGLPMKPQPVAPQPKTQMHAPQLSTAQRRRTQADQPRERDGRYAEKPGSKWREPLTGQPAALKKVSKPARPVARQPWSHQAHRQTRALPSMAAMEHRNPIAKVHWWVTGRFRRWRRKKARQFRKAFSIRG